MARIKYFIITHDSNKLANIRVRFSIGREIDIQTKTDKLIKPDFWNNETGRVRQRAEFKEADSLQKTLNDLQEHILNEFNTKPDNTIINKEWLNNAVDSFDNPNKYLQGKTTLFGYIQKFIDNSGTRINTKTGNAVCYKMRCEYQRTFDLLKEFAGDIEIDFNDIDLEFYQNFVEYLKVNKQLATNTIGKKIQTLKIFLNAATTDNINKNQKFKSHSFATLSEETDNIYLTKTELIQLYKKDLSDKPCYERVRDLFIVGCCTGLRYSDLQTLSPDHLKGDYLEIKQQKTGNRVVIPLQDTVKQILKKYKGKLPKSICNQKYNEYLKEAAKLAELNEKFIKKVITNGLKHDKTFAKHELISSHTARRTFCTNAYKDNIPTLTIMAISGHKTESAFLKYIKVNQDEHAKIMLDVWQKNGDFLKVAE